MNLLEISKVFFEHYDFTEEQLEQYKETNSNNDMVYPKNIKKGFQNALVYFLDIDIHQDQPLTTGCSKLGGLPDLPEQLDFPEEYVFIGQFNIADFKLYDINNVFPDKGIIYLFSSRNRAKTLFYDGTEDQLKPRQYPSEVLEQDEQLHKEFETGVRISFTPKLTFNDMFYPKDEILTEEDWLKLKGGIPGFSEYASSIHLLGLGNYQQEGVCEAYGVLGKPDDEDEDYDEDDDYGGFDDDDDDYGGFDNDDDYEDMEDAMYDLKKWLPNQFHFFSYETNYGGYNMNFWVDSKMDEGFRDGNFNRKVAIVGSNT